MINIKKIFLSTVCVPFLVGAHTPLRSECLAVRVFDGGVSASCGATVAGIGVGVLLVPGCVFHALALENNSPLLGMCAGASYLVGAMFLAGGIKVLFDGIKKFLGMQCKKTKHKKKKSKKKKEKKKKKKKHKKSKPLCAMAQN